MARGRAGVRLAHQVVIGRSQRTCLRSGSVAAAIDQFLRVLDANPELERFGLDDDALAVKRPDRVRRAVAQSDENGVAGDVPVRCAHRVDPRPAGVDLQPIHPRVPMEPYAGPRQRVAQGGQDPVQPVRPDVCTRVVEDVLVCAAVDQQLQARGLQGVVDSRVKLSVGVSSRAAFAEKQIRFGVRPPRTVEPDHVTAAPLQRRPAIDQIHAHAVERQDMGGVQAARAGPDHDRAPRPASGGFDDQRLLRRGFDQATALGGGGELLRGVTRGDREIHVNVESETPLAADPAGVHGPASDAKPSQRSLFDSRFSQRAAPNLALGLVDSELQVEQPPCLGKFRHCLI